MDSVALTRRLHEVRESVHRAAVAAGRDPETVRLIAVSKTHSDWAVQVAYNAGQRDFGESYAQELEQKAKALAHLPDIRWHFIGRIQTNKARLIAPRSHRVHAVHSARHARALAHHANSPVDCLLAVNLAGEDSKTGVTAANTLDVAREVQQTEGVRLRGLMTLPPADSPARPWFDQLSALAAKGRAQGLPLEELSMGMSGDYEEAIAAGATWVRVGTAIFGQRER